MKSLLAASILALAALAISSSTSSSQTQLGFDGRRARLDWDYDGTRILGHIANELHIWDAQTGRLLRTFSGHREEIQSLQFSPSGRLALSSAYRRSTGALANFPEFWSKDNSVRLWDLEDGKQIWSVDGQAGAGFSPDGMRIVTLSLLHPSGSAAEVVMWDVASTRELFRVRTDPPMSAGATLRFSADGRYFLTSDHGTAVLYDAESGREIGRMRIPVAYGLSVSNRTGVVATFGLSGIEVWELPASRRQRHIPVADSTFFWQRAEWTPDGGRVAAHGTGRDGKCQTGAWNVESGEMIGAAHCLPSYSYPLVSPDGSRFLLGWEAAHVGATYRPAQVGLYDLRSGGQLKIIESDGYLIGFSTDSRTFLVYGPAFTIYSSELGEPLRSVHLDLLRGRLE